MARISSPGAIPDLADGVPGRVCSTMMRPGSTETTLPKPFCVERLHLLELIELARIEEDGVRIEAAQQAGNGALVKGLLGGDRIGGFPLDGGEGVDESLDLCFQITSSQIAGGDSESDRSSSAAVRRNMNFLISDFIA